MDSEPIDNQETGYEKHFNNLRGLRPGLVKDLAALHRVSFEDLSVTVSIMPFGDRAVLAAYGYLTGSRNNVISADMGELIEAAFQVAMKAVDEHGISKVLDLPKD